MPEPEVLAAGAVVFRKSKGGPEVLAVHRPKYDDWSFPKGKLDQGEHPAVAAVREVAEETGLDVRLGPPLPAQEYDVAAGRKRVHYWVGRLVGGDDVASYTPNAEVDDVRWIPLAKADKRLSYPRDRATLAQAEQGRRRTTPLLVLRHAAAGPRGTWPGDDPERPLAPMGEVQAERLVPLLAAYGVTRLVSSSARRCWATLAPFADVHDVDLEVRDDLSQRSATGRHVRAQVERLLTLKEPAVLCTHRPVLPMVLSALRLPIRPLDPGAMLIAHHRRMRVVAVEPGAQPKRPEM
ncbi:MAG TPA: NUDIX hydrolase [Nocardioidaceae bacterium]|nr:NUDIX hydrolase [Nocardioidaceae bacterium]